MKVISIGRGEDCNIVLPENVISRIDIRIVHATGKMELIDMGQNGTFVNGIKLTPNIPYPVTRKDVVSFAHVRQLDWSLVPNTMRIYRYIALGAVLAVAIVVAIVFFFKEKEPDIPQLPVNPVHKEAVNDSVRQERIDIRIDVGKERWRYLKVWMSQAALTFCLNPRKSLQQRRNQTL